MNLFLVLELQHRDINQNSLEIKFYIFSPFNSTNLNQGEISNE